MTVTVTTTRNSFAGNGNQGPHSINFIILDATHIEVYWEKGSSGFGTPITGGGFTAGASGYLKKDIHYTVQNAGTSSNATITYIESGFTVDSTVTYPSSADTLVVTRNVPLTQTSDYTNNSTIDAETIENSFDKLTQISQQLDDNRGHSLKFASSLEGTTGFNTTPDTASTITQNKADRINKVVSFDSNGDLIATKELGTWKSTWTTGTAFVERDLVKDSETGAVYICLVAHTSGTFATDLANSKWEAIIDAGGFNVKLLANLTIAADETYITPYKLDLNGKTLTNNGTLICAEIITGGGTLTGSGSTTQSGPVDISSASLVTLSSTQTLTNKTLTSPKINEDVALTATATELNLLDGVSGLVQADFTKLAAIDATDTEINTVADGSTSPGTEAVAGTDGIVTNDAGTMRQTTVDTFDTYLSQTSKTLTNKKIPEIDSDAAITLDATTYVELNADNGIVYMKDGATTMLTIQLSGGNTTITGP